VPYCLFACPADDTIPFERRTILNVKVNCSVASDVYRIDSEKIQFELGVMTQAYCRDDAQIDVFFQLLTRRKH
jgi:hypothetical protein